MIRNGVIFLVVFHAVCGSQGGFLDSDLDIADGVTLVSVPVSNGLNDESGRSLGESSALLRMAKFLQGHELHVKLPSLIEKDKVSQIFADTLKAVDDTYKESAVSSRGSKGGGGGAALLGLMFAKTVGAVGIGGLALLTMKALAASALALLLSAIVGVKKLTSHDDHDDHQVIYAGHHGHHRRRRDIQDDVPYRGWAEFMPLAKNL